MHGIGQARPYAGAPLKFCGDVKPTQWLQGMKVHTLNLPLGQRPQQITSLICTVLAATMAFVGLVVFAALPHPDDKNLFVLFAPGTSQTRMMDVVTQAGAQLVAFSSLSFAINVHVDGNQTTERLRSRALLVMSLPTFAGCTRSPGRAS